MGVCSVLTAPSEDNTSKILYTARGTANEIYPGWYHAVGGTVKSIQNGIANPNGALRKEVAEELGLQEHEFEVNGAEGLVMNNFDIHPELIYLVKAKIPIEQWHNQRKTDKEVDAKFFTDTPENLANFVLGQPFDEVEDPRPIVPSGLAGYMFYGRLKYGEEWYQEVYNKLPQY